MQEITDNSRPDWKESETIILISYLEDNFAEYKNGNKQKFYRDAAFTVQSRNPLQVKNKMRKLLQIFAKQKLQERTSGESSSTWKYLARFESLFGGRENVEPTELITSTTSSEKDFLEYDTQRTSTYSSSGYSKANDAGIAQAIMMSNEVKRQATERMAHLMDEHTQKLTENMERLREDMKRKFEDIEIKCQDINIKCQDFVRRNETVLVEIYKMQAYLNMKAEK